MIVSHTHKFIFFSSSKVGTTSMENALGPYQEGAEYQFGSETDLFIPKHIPPAMVRGAFPEKLWNEYFKVVFVRNPWDWFVSQWFYNTVGAAPDRPSGAPEARAGLRQRAVGLLGSLAHRARPSEEGLLGSAPPTGREELHGRRLSAQEVDDMFQVLKRFKGLPGRDGLYQSNWVYDMDDRRIVDFVGRYETLNADFEQVTRRLGLDLTLPHLNRTGHDDYRTYYTPEAQQRVAELWAVDISNFGYEFDPGDAPTARSRQDAIPRMRSY